MTDDRRSAQALRYLEGVVRVQQRAIESCLSDILAAVQIIVEGFQRKRKLLIFGNGGSAADSQHMAAELAGRLTMDFERPGLPALALTTDSSFVTAYANDIGFDGIFERQLEALGGKDDVVFGISTSGNSKNVVRAIEYAKHNGMRSISLTGQGGRLPTMVDVGIKVPSEMTAYIQVAHLSIEHVVCHLVERELFGYEEDSQ